MTINRPTKQREEPEKLELVMQSQENYRDSSRRHGSRNSRVCEQRRRLIGRRKVGVEVHRWERKVGIREAAI